MDRSVRSGFTVVEALILTAIVGIVVAVAVPGLWRARMARNESAAIASLRAIVRAEIAYASVCGDNRYAAAFAALSVPPRGGTQPFLEPDLADTTRTHDGYSLTLEKGEGAAAGGPDCNGTPTYTAYYATAVPTSFGTTGKRSFAVNTSGTIWQTPAAGAPPEPFAAPATPIQ